MIVDETERELAKVVSEAPEPDGFVTGRTAAEELAGMEDVDLAKVLAEQQVESRTAGWALFATVADKVAGSRTAGWAAKSLAKGRTVAERCRTIELVAEAQCSTAMAALANRLARKSGGQTAVGKRCG